MNNTFEIEQSLLGGLMKVSNDNSDIATHVLRTLKRQSFYNRVHSEIYSAIKALSSNNKLFDQLSVASYLAKKNEIDIFDVDRCYLHHCDSSMLRQYTETIKDSSIERYALSKIDDLKDLISNQDNGNISQRIGLAESVLSGIINSIDNRKSKGLINGEDIANKWMDQLEAHNAGDAVNFDLGIKGLDDILIPKMIKPGALVVIGARPKMGKTFLATKIATHYVTKRDQGCSIFSMEMGDVDIWERMLSEKAKSNSNNFYTIPFENINYWDSVGQENLKLANTKIMIDDTPGIDVKHIKSEVRKANRNNKQGCIIVDYLTLMDGDSSERNDLKYGEITKQLKILAKEIGCIVVLLTQLNRGLESRTDKRPFPSDSRDTGQIEQDCDIWIGLYRERVYDINCPYNHTEAIVRLNRHGETGSAYITLENGYFEDVPKELAERDIQQYIDKNEVKSEGFTKKYKKRT